MTNPCPLLICNISGAGQGGAGHITDPTLLTLSVRSCSLIPSTRCAGQSTDLSFLDPINRADTPPKAIQLAAGELSLRVLETRRRLDAGLGPIQDTMQKRRMDGKPGDIPFVNSLSCLTVIMPQPLSWWVREGSSPSHMHMLLVHAYV